MNNRTSPKQVASYGVSPWPCLWERRHLAGGPSPQNTVLPGVAPAGVAEPAGGTPALPGTGCRMTFDGVAMALWGHPLEMKVGDYCVSGGVVARNRRGGPEK